MRRCRIGRLASLAALALVLAYGVLSFALQASEAIPLPPTLHEVTHEEARFFSPGSGGVQFDPRWLWELRPTAKVLDIEVNEDGLRGPFVPRAKGSKFRIAALGDSSTFGIGVPANGCWPMLLHDWLGLRGRDVEVLNFGMPAFTVAQGRRLYEGRVAAYSPDLVLAAFGYVHESEPANDGIGDLARLERSGALGHRLWMFLERNGTFRWCARLFEAPPRPKPATLPAGPPRLTVAEYESELAALVADVKRDGRPIALIHPPRLQALEHARPSVLEYDAKTRAVAEAAKVPLLEIHDELRKLQPIVADPAQAPGQDNFFFHVYVLTRPGAEVYAHYVGRDLLERGLLDRPADGNGAKR